MSMATDADRRFMAAAIRYAERHLGRTATNPSVGCLIVNNGHIVGRGITQIGGRPHAEAIALAEAGDRARGATAYVTLEPCAHHGRTPPCAEALVNAGVTRVVGAAGDPDERVSGRGYAILREAGITVVEGVLAAEAAESLSSYLIHKNKNRPEVIVKLALSRNGKIGVRGREVTITGESLKRQTHLLRASVDMIAVGAETCRVDDPALTVRLPGLENRSPQRLVIAPRGASGFEKAALWRDGGPASFLAGGDDTLDLPRIAVDWDGDHVALPELLDDLGARGTMRLLVEGGAGLVRSLLEANLVDRLILYVAADALEGDTIDAPVTPDTVPSRFALADRSCYGGDMRFEWTRPCSPGS